MFPVPVGPTNAAAAQYGAFQQSQQDRRYEEENPEAVAAEELRREKALAHEEDIEDEIDAIQRYENTLSGASADAVREQMGHPSHQHTRSTVDVNYPQMTSSTFTAPEDEGKEKEPTPRPGVVSSIPPATNGATTILSPTSTSAVVFHMPETTQAVLGASDLSAVTPAPQPADGDRLAQGSLARMDSRRPSVVGPRTAADVAELRQQGRINRQGSHSQLNHEDTLHLGQITDADIRNALDEKNLTFSVKDLIAMPEEKLIKLVEHVQPQHLPVLMNRRLQVHEKARPSHTRAHTTHVPILTGISCTSGVFVCSRRSRPRTSPSTTSPTRRGERPSCTTSAATWRPA